MCRYPPDEYESYNRDHHHHHHHHQQQLHGRATNYNGRNGKGFTNPCDASSSPSSKQGTGIIYVFSFLVLLAVTSICYFAYHASSPSSSPFSYYENYHFEEDENVVFDEKEVKHWFGVPTLEEVWGLSSSSFGDPDDATPTKKGLRGSRGQKQPPTNNSNNTQKPTNVSPKTNELHPRPIVVAGPSGVGKGTLINKILEKYNSIPIQKDQTKDYFGFSVSHTTRQPRPGEVDGTHYHYTTMDHMKEMVKHDEFVEYAEVHGNMYGTR
uniref:Guanylate kinase-like domain-containing protein n=1 Tax=Ditylum brightwellii TaxID=49249 RepID=A0A7S4QCM8_9STRA